MSERLRERERALAAEPNRIDLLENLHRERRRRGEMLPDRADRQLPNVFAWLEQFLSIRRSNGHLKSLAVMMGQRLGIDMTERAMIEFHGPPPPLVYVPYRPPDWRWRQQLMRLVSPPPRPWIDPLGEAHAAAERILVEPVVRAAVLERLGLSPESVLARLDEEREALRGAPWRRV